MDATISKNEKQNGIEIKFPGKPDDATLAKLHSWGFRWARFNKVWYKRYSDSMMEEVKDYFGQAEVTSANEQVREAQTSGLSIEVGAKINRNSSMIPYILSHITGGTEYLMIHDDPYPIRNNEVVSVDEIKKELDEWKSGRYSGGYLKYNGEGRFSYSAHMNHHMNFTVEGVTDKIVVPDTSLKAYNFYVPMELKVEFGDFDLKDMPEKEYSVGDRVVASPWGYKKNRNHNKG